MPTKGARKPTERAEPQAETEELVNQICDPKVCREWRLTICQEILSKASPKLLVSDDFETSRGNIATLDYLTM